LGACKVLVGFSGTEPGRRHDAGRLGDVADEVEKKYPGGGLFAPVSAWLARLDFEPVPLYGGIDRIDPFCRDQPLTTGQDQ
jgi:hypothetical protein